MAGSPIAPSEKTCWLPRLDTPPHPRYISPLVESNETIPSELERFWRTDDGLTACQRAEAYGIDLSLLDANLRLTPAQRLRQNDAILNEAEALRAAYLKAGKAAASR